MPLFDNPVESTPELTADLEPQEEGQVQEEGAELEETQEEETQEEQEQEIIEESNPEEQAGQLLAGKFKSPADLENAYLNLQRKLGEMGNELSRLRQQPQQPQQQQSRITKEQYDELNQRILYDLQTDPVGTLQKVVGAMIQNQVTPIVQPLQSVAHERWIDSNLERMAQFTDGDGVLVYPDLKEMAPTMKQVLLSEPGLANSPNGFHLAYNIAKGQAAARAVTAARENGLQEGYKNAAAKRIGQPPKTKASTKQNTKTNPADQILQDILAVRTGGLFD